jgi:hypothetical protein
VQRLLLALVLSTAVALGLLACGEESNKDRAGSAIGAETRADLDRVERFFKVGAPFAEHNADFSRSLQEEDTAGARSALDEMTSTLERMEDRLISFESEKLSGTLERYVDKLRDTTDAYERLMTYLEDEGPADSTLEDQLFDDVQRAVRAAQAEDRRLVRRLAAALPADERDEFRQRYQRRIDELREQASPTG